MIQGQTDSMELAEIMHALDMARRWALTIVPRAEDEVALEIHLKSIDAARAKLQAIMDEAVDACPQHAVTGLFEQIVRPALNDAGI